MRVGARPTGKQSEIGIFRNRTTTATISEEQLLRDQAARNASPPRAPSPEQAAAVWEQTLEEQRLGFLSDFMSADDLNARFGCGRWAALPRFAIWQKLKYRPIDNGRRLLVRRCTFL